MVQLIKMNTTMKKVTKYIALLIGGIALLSMAACSDDDGRTPSPAVDPNCIGASFVEIILDMKSWKILILKN